MRSKCIHSRGRLAGCVCQARCWTPRMQRWARRDPYLLGLLLSPLFEKVQVGPCINHTFWRISFGEHANAVNFTQNYLIGKSEIQLGCYSECISVRSWGSGRVVLMERRSGDNTKDVRWWPGVLHHPKPFNRYLLSDSAVKMLHKEPDVERQRPDGVE